MSSRAVDYLRGIGLSIILHVTLFAVGGLLWTRPVMYGVTNGEASIEVELIAAPAAAEPAAEAAPEPEQPKPLEKVDNVVPQPLPKPVPPRPVPSVQKGPVGDGSSPAPGKDAITQRASEGAHIEAKPNYLRNPAPRYPETSRKNKEEGVVLLTIDVTAAGRPASIRLAGSSGYERLDRAALEAVRRWSFEPARLGPLPVASVVRVPIRFRLSDAR